MMSGYFQNGKCEETVNVFVSLIRDTWCDPDSYSFSCVMKACGSLEWVDLGLGLHCLAKKFGFGTDPFIETSVLDMYVKCGAMRSADRLFHEIREPSLFCWNSMIYGYAKSSYGVGRSFDMFNHMPARDIVSWNTMISILSQHGFESQTLTLLIEMGDHGFKPNSMTYASVFSACGRVFDLNWGRHLHGQILRLGLTLDVFVGSGLIGMYAKCGQLEAAKRVFNSLPEPNAVSWTSLIGGFAQFGREEEALMLFKEMRMVPVATDQMTLATILSVCSSRRDMCLGAQLHCYLISVGLECVVPVANALITMYAECDNIEIVKRVFQLMPTRDIISWTALITAFYQIGDVENARAYFNKMPVRNVITWNSMLSAYVQHGYWEDSFKLYIMMLREEGMKPDWVTCATLFGACADLATLRLGNQIIAQTSKMGLDFNVSVANGIVNMYSKCGKFQEAREVFESIIDKDLISWNAMITGYAQNGQGREAIQIFENMLKSDSTPDHISFLSVLSGCSHSGLVSEGKYYFESMTRDHDIAPSSEHFACMVDLLGRAGLLEEARKMIDEMPVETNSGVWGAFLNACRIHGNAKLVEFAVKHLLQMNSEDSGSYVLLANTYLETGKLDGVAEVRKLMRERGIRKNPGCSWIEAGNMVHVFTVDDINHPQIIDVHRILEDLVKKIEDKGNYVIKKNSGKSQSYHSEKLAVAFGLMTLAAWMPIHIMKNLRVCSDCHKFIKLISLVTARELIVRDANRFHHFRNGTCSCGDYW
ncbi:hypothetical protein GIB67_026063 [Kingdonia uniflora]|uniref:DYW domain-containing protein n=1 Tax=Kingdonia uniflora TaxID=39325 RepID=A0A7J7M2Y0_9MAGN|nr:hypothetical protein GIB67_026063 [Kingdonia uniflora]